MPKLINFRRYTFITSLILFGIGILGFAFRGMIHIPDYLDSLMLILGFWGLATVALKSAHKKI